MCCLGNSTFLEAKYHAFGVLTLCDFASNPLIVIIAMNTRRNAARRLEEEIANAGVPPCGDQVPPLENDVNDDQALVNPPP